MPIHGKALEMRMRKCLLSLSVAQINEMLSINNLGFIYVNRTVVRTLCKKLVKVSHISHLSSQIQEKNFSIFEDL